MDEDELEYVLQDIDMLKNIIDLQFNEVPIKTGVYNNSKSTYSMCGRCGRLVILDYVFCCKCGGRIGWKKLC